MAIDIINNRAEIFDQLKKLDKDAKPVFGKMSPQHVVEHLAFAIGLSSGNGYRNNLQPKRKPKRLKANLFMGMPKYNQE